MDRKRLEELLASVATGRTAIDEAMRLLKSLPFTDLGMAKPDLHRSLRQGVPETIFCQGKTPQQVAAIAGSILESHDIVVATRCDAEHVAALEYNFSTVKYHSQARVAFVGTAPAEPDLSDPDAEPVVFGLDSTQAGSSRPAAEKKNGFATTIITAGTADIGVAEECAVLLEHLNFPIKRVYDVGVAGLHRLLSEVPDLQSASAIVAVAGMDGALPSVVGGLVPCPVIAVPTSIGYGTTFGGVAPLLTMLNSCAHGVTVVNIDNGFGAAMAVNRIFLSKSTG